MRYMVLVSILMFVITGCSSTRTVVIERPMQTPGTRISERYPSSPFEQSSEPTSRALIRAELRDEARALLVDLSVTFLERLLLAYLEREAGPGEHGRRVRIDLGDTLIQAGVLVAERRLKDRMIRR